MVFSCAAGLVCGLSVGRAAVGNPMTASATSAATEANVQVSVRRVRRPSMMRRTRVRRFDSAAAKVLMSRRRVMPLRISATRVRLSA